MNTIRGRLLVLLLAGLGVVLAAGGAAVYWVAKGSMLRELDAGLEARARALASLVTYDDGALEFEFDEGRTEMTPDGWFEYRSSSGEMIRRSRNLSDDELPWRAVGGDPVFEDVALPGGLRGRAVRKAFRPRIDDEYLYDPSGSAPAGRELDDESESSSESESLEDGESEDRSVSDDDSDESSDEQAAFVAGADGPPDTVVVTAAIDRGPVDSALATLLATLLVVGGGVGVTVGVLVLTGVPWGLRPLDRLRGQLGGVGGATLSTRFDDTGAPRELVPVYRELNQMLDRVEATLERERSFANAAAHELRTPLAELRSTAEVAIRWPDRERAVDAMREMLDIGREMERLVESLLLISRGNAHAVGSVADEVPMASIVQDCLARADGAIDEKGLKLTVDLNGSPPLRAPRDAVEIIVRNLIDNAIRYTPPHGSITISDGHGSNGARSLIVENGPARLEPDDVPRLFEPFWQSDEARSDREHVGLGLTVVHRIAHAIGLEVDADLAGDRLRMRLAQARAEPRAGR